MCEFKIIKKNDGSQILEDIVVISYTDNNELLFRDVMGAGDTLSSALILDVNTLNQTCTIFEHELVKPFIDLMKLFESGKATSSDMELFIQKMNLLKKK